ncbi:MAG: N-6 DNA methylase [Candidatus Methanomethylicia archaeon]
MGIVDKVAEILKDHITRARSANSHPAKLIVLSRLLEELFGVRLDELIPGIETRLGSKILGLRGSADLMFSNVVFEVKVDLARELDDAKQKLKKYLQVLHEREPGKKNIGIATDVIEFRAYKPIFEQGQIIDLKEIGSINIVEKTPQESVLWLDSFIFSQPKIRPSAQDLKCRFGPTSPTYSLVTDSLHSLWNEVENEKDVKLKLDLWAKNMEIVYGSKPELNSFIDHTYLVTLVKLIVYLRLSGDNIVREDNIRKALTGEYFSSYGIANLIEEDFFAWIMHPKISSKALRLFCDVAKELLRYNFSLIDEDFFKEIYQEIVERGERHRIGEYYTPEWLAQLTLKEAIGLWRENNQGFPRILDPACGSGTFLCNAIHMAREELENEGKSLSQILDFIINNVVGIDINPLAAIIARANYLIALGDLLQLGKPIIIPVYVADSIKMPKVLTTLATKEKVPVYEIDADGHPIQIPKSVVVQKAISSKVFQDLKNTVNAYKAGAKRDETFEIFKREASTYLSADEFKILKTTLNTIMTLIDKGLDTIWIFILNNIYAPIALMESKFDMVVGNPPWIAMRYIENKNYQDFLKRQVLTYELLKSAQVHLFSNMEAATLFFCRSSDLYLKDEGLIAFVMPRSVLTGAFHHASFKQLRKPKMKLFKIFDLENVSPLFNVPSCVLIAVKGSETKYPVLARKYAGNLPEKNIKLIEAVKYLTANDYMYEPPVIPIKYSIYYDKVKAGASLIPRSLWFIEFDIHPILGIDLNKPLVKTAEDALEEAKDQWKGIELKGNIEADFIYATLLSKDLVPFGYYKLRPVVLPLELSLTGYRLLDVDVLRNRGFILMAEWLEKAQRLWEERGTERALNDYPRVISWINYMGKLTNQNPAKRYIVLYNASGTNIASCVIDKHSLPPFQVLRAKIIPKGFIAYSKTFFFETSSKEEAHFICSVLNSNIVNDAIKPLQPRGLFGEREVQRRPFMFPIPKFNEDDRLHIRLAELSKICHAKVASLRFTKKSTAGLRKEAREAVKKEIAEIDEIVSQLLGF